MEYSSIHRSVGIYLQLKLGQFRFPIKRGRDTQYVNVTSVTWTCKFSEREWGAKVVRSSSFVYTFLSKEDLKVVT